MIDVSETEIAVVPALQATVGETGPQSSAGKARLIRTRQAGTIGNESARTAILAVRGATIGHGIETEDRRGGRPDGMMIAPPEETEIHSRIGKEVPG